MIHQTIETLCGLAGVSGCEDAVREEIIRMIDRHCQYHVDALGNVIVFKSGRKQTEKRIMLSAHMDEVGLMVTYIEDNGLLRFSAVGGIDRRVLPGKAVRIGNNGIFGVVGQKAVHLRSAAEKDTAPDMDSLRIDIGAASAEEAQRLVSLGDRAIFASQYFTFGDGLVCGKALDDRAGCALLVEMIRGELEYDTHFAFTVQEETGCVGDKTAAAQIAPDIAIAVETTTAADIPNVSGSKQVCQLKGGPVISYMDRGTVYDMTLYQQAMELAVAKGITAQTKTVIAGGNEARSVQISGNGAKVLAVSIPCRYLHTPACVASIADIDATMQLLQQLVAHFGA